MSKKRFKKGIESLKKVIDYHRNVKLKKALAEGNVEMAAYYEKEIKNLERGVDKKQNKLLPRSKRLKKKRKR